MLAEICAFSDHQTAIIRLREQVFIIEQGVPKVLEIDGLDPDCQHAVIFDGNSLVGTGRLTIDGKIGRIAVAATHRRRGLGSQLMAKLEQRAEDMGLSVVSISAQVSALAFYQRLKYRQCGPIFVDAGIEHLPMTKVLKN